jgi:hypothetical protein
MGHALSDAGNPNRKFGSLFVPAANPKIKSS